MSLYELPFFLLTLTAVVCWVVYVVFFEGRPNDHDRCLQNIARLERELGIGQPPSALQRPKASPRALPRPKEEWLIDRYGPVDPKNELARTLMARGLLYSGEWETALRYYQKEGQQ